MKLHWIGISLRSLAEHLPSLRQFEVLPGPWNLADPSQMCVAWVVHSFLPPAKSNMVFAPVKGHFRYPPAFIGMGRIWDARLGGLWGGGAQIWGQQLTKAGHVHQCSGPATGENLGEWWRTFAVALAKSLLILNNWDRDSFCSSISQTDAHAQPD